MLIMYLPVMRLFTLLLFFCTIIRGSYAQLPYTEVQYDYRVETAIYYGTSINYAGNPVDLYLDLYKPVGDANTSRPMIIIAFGGAWIGGARNSTDVTMLAPWFARRGYVVAGVDYRLGFHPSTGSGSNTVTCVAITREANCAYPADTNEMIRALYRGMQDIKGAIRFMKARSVEDSTCSENVYLAGVSAGGFNVLAAAFMDDEAEKPYSAGELPDAAGNASNPLSYCHGYFNHDTAVISRSRPDLGSIQGTIALNGHSAEIKGVANFIGGMMQDLFALSPSTPPLLYFHHQTSDLVVSCGYSPLLSSLSYNCLDPFGFLGCAHVWHTPRAFGSCGIKTLLETKQYPIGYLENIVNNGGANCLQDPPGHSVLNPQQRVGEIAAFFAPRIAETEAQSCSHITNMFRPISPGYRLYPVPAGNRLMLHTPKPATHIHVYDISGRRCPAAVVATGTNEAGLDISALPGGMYHIRWKYADGETGTARFIR